MRGIIIGGLGEIGSALYIRYSLYHDLALCDVGVEPYLTDYEIMLVAIPYSDSFIETVQQYQKLYRPTAIIIFSTVAVGTTSQLANAVHSPVEGKHPRLAESLEQGKRWVGGYNPQVARFFQQAGECPKYLSKPEHTEFLKLASTALYGLNIEFARYRKSVADQLDMDYSQVKQFDLDYNDLYQDLGLQDFQRYILDPPEGNIGGHCVVPNAKLLDSQFPSLFLKEIYRNKEVH